MTTTPAIAVARLAAVVVGVLLGLPGVAAACDAVRTDGAWTVVDRPPQLAEIVTYAPDPQQPDRILASDGRIVVRTQDGGCTWEEVFRVTTDLPDLVAAIDNPAVESLSGLLDPVPRIEKLLVGDGEAGRERVLMLLSGYGQTALALAKGALPSLLVSGQGGASGTWQPAGEGLSPVAEVVSLTHSPADANRVYAATRLSQFGSEVEGGNPTVQGELLVSDDGGATFASRSRGTPIVALAPDPVQRDVVWWTDHAHRVRRSSDAGATATDIGLPPAADPDREHWRRIAIGPAEGRDRVAVSSSRQFNSATNRVVTSDDGGASFTERSAEALGAPPTDLAFGPAGRDLYVTGAPSGTPYTGPGLLRLRDGRDEFESVDDLRLGALLDLRPGRRSDGQPVFWLRRNQRFAPRPGEEVPGDLIARYEPPRGDGTGADGVDDAGSVSANDVCPDAPPFGEVAVKASEPASFSPAPLDLTLEPGRSQATPLRVDLPPTPTPLDVAFLLDSSTSMDPAIAATECGLEDLVRGLATAGIDARYALATYQGEDATRYRRLRDLGPPDLALQDSIRRVFTRGGSEETPRSALLQLATGAGLFDGARELIAPDRQVAFREGSLRAVLHVTDEKFPVTSEQEHEPARDDALRALTGKRIRHIGVQIIDGDDAQVGGQPLPNRAAGMAHDPVGRKQLEDWSADTGAVAPADGVQCDDVPGTDVGPGEPLVCSLVEAGIEKRIDAVLLGLLRAVRDRQPVEIALADAGGFDVRVEGGGTQEVDVKQRQTREVQVLAGCAAEQAGQVASIRLVVRVAGREVAETSGRLRCGERQGEPALAPPDATPGAMPAPAGAPVPAAASSSAPAPAPAGEPASPLLPGSSPTSQAGLAAVPPPPPPAPVPLASAGPGGAAAGSGAGAGAGASSGAGAGAAAGSGSSVAAAAPGATPASAPSAVPSATAAEAPGAALAGAHARRQRAPALARALASESDHAMVASRSHSEISPAPLLVGGATMAGAAWALGLARPRRRRDARIGTR